VTTEYPPQPTFFVGRNKEIEDIVGLINNPHCRLLTLSGPGGIGKTRLAIETARQRFSTLSDGSAFISPQNLTSKEAILTALAESLQIRLSPDRGSCEQVLECLAEKYLLLVLDSFEYVPESIILLTDILQHAPHVKILTTSRELLNLMEEWVYEIGGLSIPASDFENDIEHYGAVQLFMHNARRIHHSFVLTLENKPAVSRICRLVGGMPLGLELASAWVRALPCDTIADEIRRGLDILEATAHNSPLRHRSIRAVFESMWCRLTESERHVFQSLSVFRGSFTLEAAVHVAGATHAVLRSLIDRSLLRVDNTGRYVFHELLRQYGEERLNGVPKVHEQTLAAHRAYFMNLLGEFGRELICCGKQGEAVEKIGKELENISVAWRLAIDQGQFAELSSGAEALWGFICMRGWDREGAEVFRESAAQLRSRSADHDSELYLRNLAAVLAFQGFCTIANSEHEARTAAQESLSILRRLPVGKEMVFALQLHIQLCHDESEKAQTIQECLDVARAFQPNWWVPLCMFEASDLAINRGDYADAKTLLDEVLISAHQSPYQASAVQASIALSQIALLEGMYAEAQTWAHKALLAAEDSSYAAAEWWVHSAIADAALLQGDYTTAQSHYSFGLTICQEMGEHRGTVFEFNGLGCVASGLNDPVQARRSFYQALCAAKKAAVLPVYLDTLSGIAGLLSQTGEAERAFCLAAYVAHQPCLERITKVRNTLLLQSLTLVLAPERVVDALEQSKRLDFDKALSTLLLEMNQQVEKLPALTGDVRHSDPLTERELEVLRLIADGLSNYEIAVRLFLGVSTVKTHINRIFSKLCAKNRTQAVAGARQLGLF